MSYTLEQQISEVAREIALRRNVYKGFVARGKLTQERADRQIALMEAVRATLEALRSEQSRPVPARYEE